MLHLLPCKCNTSHFQQLFQQAYAIPFSFPTRFGDSAVTKELPFSYTAALLKLYQIAMFTLLASRPASLPSPGYSSRHMGWLSDGMADIWVVQNRKAARRYQRCGNRFCFLRQPHTAFRPEDPGSLRCRLEPKYRSCSQQDMLRYQPPRSNRQMVLS